VALGPVRILVFTSVYSAREVGGLNSLLRVEAGELTRRGHEVVTNLLCFSKDARASTRPGTGDF